jgi:multiple sugar transport system permease protein
MNNAGESGRSSMTVLCKRKSIFQRAYESRRDYLYILPAAFMLIGVLFLPLAGTFYTSFFSTTPLGARQHFDGFHNFSFLLDDPIFWQCLAQTFLYLIIVLAVTLFLATLVALVLDETFWGQKLFRSLLLLPWATSLSVAAITFVYMFNELFGTINGILVNAHIISEPIAWLAHKDTAFFAIVIVGIWVQIPFTAIILLSGLNSIDPFLYEAASMDGVKALQKFKYIIFPSMKSVFLTVTVLDTIYVFNFNSFVISWTMTRGGPVNYTDVAISYLYKKAFQFLDFGVASAMATIFFLLLLLMSIAYVKLIYREEM